MSKQDTAIAIYRELTLRPQVRWWELCSQVGDLWMTHAVLEWAPVTMNEEEVRAELVRRAGR